VISTVPHARSQPHVRRVLDLPLHPGHQPGPAAHGLPEFNLIVCDEAHRTAGAIFENEDESAFVRVHDGNFIHARKRLYMTATLRIYVDTAKVSGAYSGASWTPIPEHRGQQNGASWTALVK
jgi:hypothetical protein